VRAVAAADLERGRQAYAERAWTKAHGILLRLEETSSLDPDDVERLAVAAYMLARDDECAVYLERAHERFLALGAVLRAVRCAFWLGMTLMLRGEVGQGGGWLGRAQRLLEREPIETVEHGYLLLPVAFRHEAEGDLEAAAATAGQAAEIGERFGDADLFALGAHAQGHWLAASGDLERGFSLLDEAMVAATTRVESPIVTGVVYCGVILTCVETHDVRRAQEWTAVLSRWCEDQPDLVAFTGRCLVHRAEIMQLHGDWSTALEEAQRAGERLAEGFNRPATAQAFYRQGELHRLRGDLDAAERAYAAASRYGFEPQPGLALLRLAQGRPDGAGASIRRVLAEVTERSRRTALLPAAVEIMVELGELDDAKRACSELEQIAEDYGSSLLAAAAAHAWGSALLREGDAAGALASLRRASKGWSELEAPYEAARARLLVGLACRELGDEDGASWELRAARDAFAALGAVSDVTRADALLSSEPERETYGLSARELEVLRLVAGGMSNREIAGTLVISEHTVARHLQNLFVKLDVSSRTAASAFAFEHDLV
jgi:DNA-binding CsgD family transcriptional regulator